MKTLLTLSLLLASYAGLACQIGLNEQNINNEKIAAAANEFLYPTSSCKLVPIRIVRPILRRFGN